MQLEIVDGQMLTSPVEHLFRSARRPFCLGDVVHLNGLTIRVVDIGSEGPTRLNIEFDESIDSTSYVFFVFCNGEFKRLDRINYDQIIELPYEGIFGFL